jgi:tetratricopeptide (TPR) repeat protein
VHDASAIQNQLCSRALAAEDANRVDEATILYRRAIKCDPGNPTPYLFLGHALQAQGRHEAAAQVYSLGADLNSNFINIWRSGSADQELRKRSKCADEVIRSHLTSLHQNCIAAYRDANPGANVDRVAGAIWCQTHDGEFDYRHPRQRPHLFYVPDLPPRPVYPAAEIEWSAALVSDWNSIKDEFLAAQRHAADEQMPYLDTSAASLGTGWEPLAASLGWGSFHLFKKATPNNRLIDMFPETLESLDNIPLVRNASGNPTEILFSVLQGEQHIPTHFGVANTDIAVHLPIIVTPDSAIRVLDTVYEWRAGEVFAFDDAFEHESWNKSPAARVNLLFEVWHPDLSNDERSALIATFDARLQWTKQRSVDY